MYVCEHVGMCVHVCTDVGGTQILQDSRFNKEVDQQTGYRTRSLLCMPILNAEDHVIGVAQIMNKAEGEEFTERDEEVRQL